VAAASGVGAPPVSQKTAAAREQDIAMMPRMISDASSAGTTPRFAKDLPQVLLTN